jgi:hypothetical protein
MPFLSVLFPAEKVIGGIVTLSVGRMSLAHVNHPGSADGQKKLLRYQGRAFYKLCLSEESVSFFLLLKSKYLESSDYSIDLWAINEAKSSYGSNAFRSILMRALNSMEMYQFHNDRDLSDCYHMAFWLIYLKEEVVPMNEACKHGVERLLERLEKDLHGRFGWGRFNFQEVDTAFRGLTFQPVATSENRNALPSSHQVQEQRCLLL